MGGVHLIFFLLLSLLILAKNVDKGENYAGNIKKRCTKSR